MHVSFRNSVALVALTGAAAASWYFSRPEPAAPRAESRTGDAPLGYYLRDATLFGTDESGRRFFRIHAGEAVQAGEEAHLELTDVRVEYRDDEAVDWTISAERAVTPDDRSYLDLEQVRLANDADADAADANQRHMIIETSQLRLDADDYLASTEAAVQIRVGDATIEGVGLRARLREGYVELKSQVHGRSPR